jgi:hypothetical protein
MVLSKVGVSGLLTFFSICFVVAANASMKASSKPQKQSVEGFVSWGDP